MNKEQLAPWIEKLIQAEKKDRNGIVTEMCREHGLNIGDAWSLLKEAGFDPKAAPGALNPQGSGDTPPAADNTLPDTGIPPLPQEGGNTQIKEGSGDTSPAVEGNKVSVTLRHKTGYPKYRRAGLILSQKPETHEVTETQLAILKKDTWVEVIET
ncbi:MAG: hypothetical protein LBS37_06900 [Treponema sp.]|jgi:hypothetical protein|nr:hypothetical protein [Treponema sp.]